MDWTAVWVSARLSLMTMLVLLVIGVPIAYWNRFFQNGVGSFSSKRSSRSARVAADGPRLLHPGRHRPASPVGRGYARLAGHGLPFTFEGLLIASVLYSLPFAVQPFSTAFASVDGDCSKPRGRSRIARIDVPAGRTAVVDPRSRHRHGAELCAHVGRVGVVLMVGGNLAGVTRTVSVSIYDSVQALNYQAAWETSLLLLVVSFAILSVTYALQKSVWAVWPTT